MTCRVAIFGCGYVGKSVAKAALARGWQVDALTRNPDTARELERMGVRSVTGLLQESIWHDLIEPAPDHVVNCVSSAGGGLRGYRESYVDGLRSILRWTERGQPGSFIYTSSTSVYPQADGREVDESASTEEASPAGKLLLESELVLTQGKLPRTFVLRLAGIYGPGRHALLDQVRSRQPIPGRDNYFLNLIYRDDIANVVFKCMEGSHPGGLFNLADDDPNLRGAIAGWLAEQLHLPQPTFAPSRQSHRTSIRSTGMGLPNRRIANTKIKEELGWIPVAPSFKDGYSRIFEIEGR